MGSHSEVLVVGGGVIGLACAHYLARDGRSVQVIEKETVGAGASHGNCGLIFISHLMPLCSPGVIRHELMRMFRRGSPLYVHPSPSLTRLDILKKYPTLKSETSDVLKKTRDELSFRLQLLTVRLNCFRDLSG